MSDIKQIKEQLIIKHFNFNDMDKNINYNKIKDYYFFISRNFEGYSIWEFNNNIVFHISEKGNLVFAFQQYEKNRNEIKKVLEDYLNKNVFHNLVLKEKLENKYELKNIKQKVKKI